MVRPVERTATGSAAETAGSGLGFGLLGAIAGGAIATAAFVGGGALIAAVAVDLLATLGTFGLASEAVTVGGLATGFVGTVGGLVGGVAGVVSGGIPMGAAIGAGGGALAGITGKSKQIKAQSHAAHQARAGHSAAVQQQIAEQRAQAVADHTPGVYNQGLQDGYQKGAQDVMTHLQQAAVEQQTHMQQDPMQMAHAEPEAGHDVEKASFADKILNERGGHKADTHAEQAIASKEQAAGEASLA